jgi:hypothetical protein
MNSHKRVRLAKNALDARALNYENRLAARLALGDGYDSLLEKERKQRYGEGVEPYERP